MEKFVAISGYEGVYEINKKGEIRSLKYALVSKDGVQQGERKLLKPFMRTDGRCYVNLYIDGKRKRESVARLVAETFIPEYRKGRTVYFKDGNESNYHYDNLTFDGSYQKDRLKGYMIRLTLADTGEILEFNDAYKAAKAIKCAVSSFYLFRDKLEFMIRGNRVELISK